MPNSSVKSPKRPAKTGPNPAARPVTADKPAKAASRPATAEAVLAELKRLGTEQNVKVYRRHGATDPVFGVSYANLDALAKRIGKDQALAAALWQTRNFDAMNLASKIAQPEALDGRALQDWIKAVNSHPTSLAFAALASRGIGAAMCLPGWTGSRHEHIRAAGYDTLAAMLKDAIEIPDGFLSGVIDTIEREIQQSPNRARHSMNNALIAIGGYRPGLRSRALAAAKRIGQVQVDHGETSCKTPDAVAYINKMAARKA